MPTPNTQRVPLDLDRPRKLLLDLNAYCAAEDLTGKNYMKQDVWADLTFRDVRVLVFVGLKHEDKKLTLEQVGAMINTSNMRVVISALTAAFLNSMPEPDKKEEVADPLEVRRTGATDTELDRELSLAPTS